MTKPVPRTLGYTDLLRETFRLYKSNFLLFLGISAVVQVPLWFLAMSIPPAGVAGYIGVVVSAAGLAVSGAASIWAISCCYLGTRTSVVSAYRAILPKVLPLVITTLIRQILTVLGLIFFIVPAILLTFVIQVVTLEGKAYRTCLKRCVRLVKSSFVRVGSVVVTAFLVSFAAYWVLTAGVSYIFGGKFRSFPQPPGLTPRLLCAAIGALVFPITQIMPTLLYYDLRLRTEWFNLRTLAAEMGVSRQDAQKPDAS
jgi:hypothetical protein